MQAPRKANSRRLESALQAAAADCRKALPSGWRGCSAALLDDACNFVGATHSARLIEISCAAAAISAFFKSEWRDGDVAVTNDPYHGSSHLLQLTAISPIGMASGAIKGFAAIHADLPDLGGWEIGGDDPRSLDIWAEGARIVPVKAALGGRMRRELLELLALNSRTPKLVQHIVVAIADAAIALARGAGAMGAEFDAAAISVGKSAAAAVSDILRGFPRGAFHGSGTARVPGFPELEVRIDIKLAVEDGVLHVDVLRAPEKSVRPINATPSMTRAAVLQGVEAALRLEPGTALGLNCKLHVDVPPDSAVAVTDWLPVAYARRVTCRATFLAVLEALSAAGFGDVDAEQWWRNHSGLDEADIDVVSGKASVSRRSFLQLMEAAAGEMS